MATLTFTWAIRKQNDHGRSSYMEREQWTWKLPDYLVSEARDQYPQKVNFRLPDLQGDWLLGGHLPCVRTLIPHFLFLTTWPILCEYFVCSRQSRRIILWLLIFWGFTQDKMANLLEFSKIRQMPNNGSRVDLMPLYFPEDRRWQLALFIESGGEAYTYVLQGRFSSSFTIKFF